MKHFLDWCLMLQQLMLYSCVNCKKNSRRKVKTYTWLLQILKRHLTVSIWRLSLGQWGLLEFYNTINKSMYNNTKSRVWVDCKHSNLFSVKLVNTSVRYEVLCVFHCFGRHCLLNYELVAHGSFYMQTIQLLLLSLWENSGIDYLSGKRSLQRKSWKQMYPKLKFWLVVWDWISLKRQVNYYIVCSSMPNCKKRV